MSRLAEHRTRRPRQGEGHRAARLRGLQSSPDLGIAFRRPEAHDDIFGPKNRIEPGLHQQGEIERRKRALADDHRMHEFHRDVLRIGSVWAAPKGEQAPAAQKALRHLAAGFGQTASFARKRSSRRSRCAAATALRSVPRVSTSFP